MCVYVYVCLPTMNAVIRVDGVTVVLEYNLPLGSLWIANMLAPKGVAHMSNSLDL